TERLDAELSGWDRSCQCGDCPGGNRGSGEHLRQQHHGCGRRHNGYFAPPGAGGLNFYTATPCRVVDTRNVNGSLGGPIMAAGTTRTFPLPSGACGLPVTAGAYSLNVTVVPSGFLGYLTAWPTGQSQPSVSTL